MNRREFMHTPALTGAFAEMKGFIERILQPDLIVATGDLTHRGRRDQHRHQHAYTGAQRHRSAGGRQ